MDELIRRPLEFTNFASHSPRGTIGSSTMNPSPVVNHEVEQFAAVVQLTRFQRHSYME